MEVKTWTVDLLLHEQHLGPVKLPGLDPLFPVVPSGSPSMWCVQSSTPSLHSPSPTALIWCWSCSPLRCPTDAARCSTCPSDAATNGSTSFLRWATAQQQQQLAWIYSSSTCLVKGLNKVSRLCWGRWWVNLWNSLVFSGNNDIWWIRSCQNSRLKCIMEIFRRLSESRWPIFMSLSLIVPFQAGQLPGALWGEAWHLRGNCVCCATLQRQQAHAAGELVAVAPWNIDLDDGSCVFCDIHTTTLYYYTCPVYASGQCSCGQRSFVWQCRFKHRSIDVAS